MSRNGGEEMLVPVESDESAVVAMAARLYFELQTARRQMEDNDIKSRRRALAGACVRAVAKSFGIDSVEAEEGRLADAVRSCTQCGDSQDILRRLASVRTERGARVLEEELRQSLTALRSARQQQKEAEYLAAASLAKRDAMARETGLLQSAGELDTLAKLATRAQEAADHADAQLEVARSRCALAADEMAQAARRAQHYADAAAAADAAATAADQAMRAHNTRFEASMLQSAKSSRIQTPSDSNANYDASMQKQNASDELRAAQSSLEATRQARIHEQHRLDAILAEHAHTEARLQELQLQLKRGKTLLHCRESLESGLDNGVFARRRRRRSTSYLKPSRAPAAFGDQSTVNSPPDTDIVFDYETQPLKGGHHPRFAYALSSYSSSSSTRRDFLGLEKDKVGPRTAFFSSLSSQRVSCQPE